MFAFCIVKNCVLLWHFEFMTSVRVFKRYNIERKLFEVKVLATVHGTGLLDFQGYNSQIEDIP